MPIPLRHAGLLALTLAGTAPACAPREVPEPVWESVDPVALRQPGRFAHPELSESSGAALSRRFPGVFWTHNDSGNPAWLFATDTLGAHLGALELTGLRNTDWEELAWGPCPEADGCLYLADTGDNVEFRREVFLYRLPEPDSLPDGPFARPHRVTGRLVVTYPDRPRDVEGMFVTPNGDVHLISKGRSDGIVHYVVAASAWAFPDTIARATLVERLPLPIGFNTADLVTGAALAPMGDRVAIRSYRAVYLFALGADGRLTPHDRTVCPIDRVEQQGEAIAWWDDRTLLLTSEAGSQGPGEITLLQCVRNPAPDPA